jgi:hypothetical protein
MRINLYFIFLLAFFTLEAQDLKLYWYNDFPTDQVPRYEKIEFGIIAPEEITTEINKFTLRKDKTGLNPFDPSQVQLNAILELPSGAKRIIPGFYYIPYKRNLVKNEYEKDSTICNWRVRLSSEELGKHQIKFEFTVGSEKTASRIQSFDVSHSNHKGHLYIDKNDNERLKTASDSNTFIAIGMNICHAAYGKLFPDKMQRYEGWINKFAENNGNLVRFELGSNNGLPDWYQYDNYLPAMHVMWERDNLHRLCEKKGVYFSLFRHHVEVEAHGPAWNGISWEQNPYRNAFDLKEVEYFINPEVIKYQKYCDRYIFARWGYSSNLAYYGYSEVDNWLTRVFTSKNMNPRELSKKDEQYGLDIFIPWLKEHQNFIRNLGYKHVIFCSSYANSYEIEYDKKTDGVFKNSDIVAFHMYNNEVARNFNARIPKIKELKKLFKKPILLEETGYLSLLGVLAIDKTGTGFHNDIWSTSFFGLMANAQWWWWDRGIFHNDLQKDLLPLHSFLSTIDYNKQYEYKSFKNKLGNDKYTLEAYYMISKDGDKAYGWLNNATYYWRNFRKHNPQIQSLIDSGYLVSDEKFEDGYEFSATEKNSAYSSEEFKQADGEIEFLREGELTFKIQGLKPSPVFGKKIKYAIRFYRTDIPIHEQNKAREEFTFTSSVIGTANISIPELLAKIEGYYLKERCFTIERID